MSKLLVEVPSDLAKKFADKKIVKYEDILSYEDSLKYNFNDEKVTLEELNDFLWESISSKNNFAC